MNVVSDEDVLSQVVGLLISVNPTADSDRVQFPMVGAGSMVDSVVGEEHNIHKCVKEDLQ